MKHLVLLLTLTTSIILTSCGGNSGSTSTGGVYYSHPELAQEFVHRLYTDLGIDVSLVKTYTLQDDYVVVYDHDLYTYDAYYIGNYNVGENLATYLNIYDSSFYYDLFEVPGTVNVYEDWYTGYQFDETSKYSKDLQTIGGLITDIQNKKIAQKFEAEYGFTAERALNVAKLASQWKTLAKTRSMTAADANGLSMGLLGFDIAAMESAEKAALEGDDSEKQDLIAQAADFNGSTPEAANDLIKFFTK